MSLSRVKIEYKQLPDDRISIIEDKSNYLLLKKVPTLTFGIKVLKEVLAWHVTISGLFKYDRINIYRAFILYGLFSVRS